MPIITLRDVEMGRILAMDLLAVSAIRVSRKQALHI